MNNEESIKSIIKGRSKKLTNANPTTLGYDDDGTSTKYQYNTSYYDLNVEFTRIIPSDLSHPLTKSRVSLIVHYSLPPSLFNASPWEIQK